MALALAQAGAAVLLVARRKDALEDAAAEISVAGGRVAIETADMLALDTLSELHGKVSQAFGAPDILVNAAGINPRKGADEITSTDWSRTIDLNLSAPFFMAQACVPAMREKALGNIINIASLQSFRAFADGIAYGASKGGIAQLTRAMAEAWSRHGITANAILPGFFPTELTGPVFANAELSDHHANMTAIGRNGALSDLDGATIFLASRASAYVTGQILAVDGGYTAK